MRASGYARAASNWYCEDEQIVEDLLRVEKFHGKLWDPAAGIGNIPKVLRRRGYDCMGSDVADRGYGEQIDFLAITTERRVTSIVCNPPYEDVIEPWIEKAMSLTSDRVAVLARLAFLEGQGRKKNNFFRRNKLARLYVSARRLSMPPGELLHDPTGPKVKRKGGSVAYGWFVFDHDYNKDFFETRIL